MMWQLAAGVAGGAVVGLGGFVALREVLPAVPPLGAALHRLHRTAEIRQPALARLAHFVRVPERELNLLGRSREQYTGTLLGLGLTGLALPPAAAVLLSLLGVGVGITIPVVAGPICAAVFVVTARRELTARAARARREFVRAVCMYLDLVALQLSAAHGPVEALERAAAVCDGWVFDRISDALLRAQLQLRFPWQELRETADRIGVPELGDVGAIVQASGTEGAQVQDTLRQHADSLRDQLRTDALARAEAITGRLDIPGAALVFVLVAFVLYPFLTRL
jgi:Flp pilus assembly protein TadB